VSETVVSLLSQYGYVVLGVLVFAMNCGVPVPGHTAYVVACIGAARGTLSLPIVFAVGASTSFLGGWVGYALGRRGGRSLVEHHGSRVGLTAERLATIDQFFVKHGIAAVFFLRFFVVLRTFGSIFAGVSGFPVRRYLAVSLASAATWGAVYAAVGHFFRESWPLIEERQAEVGVAILALLALIGLGHVIWRRRRRR